MSLGWIVLLFSIYFIGTDLSTCTDINRDLLVITVATNKTDGYNRFIRSTKINGLRVKVLGLGDVWKGGDMNYLGGGQKINLLKDELEKIKDQKNLVIMFSDSYDVVVTGGQKEILENFDSMDARIVFGAEDFCWPNESLANQYPKVAHGYKYLNSGGFIGYAPELYELVAGDIKNTDDDQLYYTNIFLNESKRDNLKIKLDTHAKIFQNLHGNSGDVSLKFLADDTRLTNTVYQTTPVLIHGNGPSKKLLNSLGNYLAKSWTSDHGCMACQENKVYIDKLMTPEYPVILLGIFVEKAVPFLDEMLLKVTKLSYPKSHLHLFVHNQVKYHHDIITAWVKEQEENGYRSIKYVSPKDNIKEWHGRNMAVKECITLNCDAFFSIDGEVHVDNTETLKLLVSYNRPFIGAIINRPGKAWSTFWGAVTDDGFYARSTDYMDIVNNIRRGIWNVPYVSCAYLIQKEVLNHPYTRPNYIHNLLDADMAMAANFRDKGMFMYVTNLAYFGHLIDPDFVNVTHIHDDMWQMVTNNDDWEQRYIHEDYYKALQHEGLNDMPCPDVFWFPLFSERYCKELIEIMEDNGKWSTGKNNDSRLQGSYENVPTIDIHMNQVGYEAEWLWILKNYVKPMAEKVYLGYNSDARAIMNFVVRYKPTEQSFLKAHHDSSTYTVNIGLNKPNIDYKGGGAHFIRYNCSVIDTKVGWSLIHPGRLTHFHEGLTTTEGTRYILISFIDP